MNEFELPPPPPSSSSTPLADAVKRIGESGEGLGVDVAARSAGDRAVAVEGWWEWGKRNQFGAGGAVQLAKDAWSAAGKFRWRP